jgi:hypothetical protein
MEVALDEALAEVVVVFRQVGIGQAAGLKQQAGFAPGVVVPVGGCNRLVAGTCRRARLVGACGAKQVLVAYAGDFFLDEAVGGVSENCF